MRTFAEMEPDTAEKISFSLTEIPYADTGQFSRIVTDYLSEDEKLKPFYGRFPHPENFGAQIDEKRAHFPHRKALAEALRAQYAGAGLKCRAVDVLEEAQAYTVTTGHQVCLFTGPVYFIYKIITAVKTCRELALKYPSARFVPVFWMATEDHDFAEANHFRLRSARFEWESGQGGAVGRMSADGLEEVAARLEAALGTGYSAGALVRLFREAYLGHADIAGATRFLVHALFGKYGVICVDGDDPALKSLAVPAFRRELFEGIAAPAKEETDAALAEHYGTQAHARDINLFYLADGLRERIVRSDSGRFRVLNTDLEFADADIEKLLEEHPERFSPNVILRPLYQEIILPNLAYIGGGGELAYWFQLKGVFRAFEIPFPILMLRNSVLIIDAETRELAEKLGLEDDAVFAKAETVETRLLRRESSAVLNLDKERDRLDAVFEDIRNRLGAIDFTLERSVDSGHARTERIVKNLEKKMLRAERKKQEVLLDRYARWRERLFPGSALQERSLNMAEFYLPYGPDFIAALAEKLNPFNFKFSLVHAGKGADAVKGAEEAV